MKYFELDQEEQAQLEAIENGEFVSLKDLEKAKREAVASAKNSLNKTKNINIRLTERDLYKLKTKAVREGIPYQTLASSILHKSAT
jgi:predicted DNA binding CopG/RHH family protein